MTSNLPRPQLPEIVNDFINNPEGFETNLKQDAEENAEELGMKLTELITFNSVVRGTYDETTEEAIRTVKGIVDRLTKQTN